MDEVAELAGAVAEPFGAKGEFRIGGFDVVADFLQGFGFVPAGVDDGSKYCDDTSVNYNWDCTARILLDEED